MGKRRKEQARRQHDEAKKSLEEQAKKAPAPAPAPKKAEPAPAPKVRTGLFGKTEKKVKAKK